MRIELIKSLYKHATLQHVLSLRLSEPNWNFRTFTCYRKNWAGVVYNGAATLDAETERDRFIYFHVCKSETNDRITKRITVYRIFPSCIDRVENPLFSDATVFIFDHCYCLIYFQFLTLRTFYINFTLVKKFIKIFNNI